MRRRRGWPVWLIRRMFRRRRRCQRPGDSVRRTVPRMDRSTRRSRRKAPTVPGHPPQTGDRPAAPTAMIPSYSWSTPKALPPCLCQDGVLMLMSQAGPHPTHRARKNGRRPLCDVAVGGPARRGLPVRSTRRCPDLRAPHDWRRRARRPKLRWRYPLRSDDTPCPQRPNQPRRPRNRGATECKSTCRSRK